MAKIITFGAKGMVGSRVLELLGKDFEFVAPDEREVDITKGEKLKAYLGKEKPQVIINFAAITDVNTCETERENKEGIVWKVNALAPGYLSELSHKNNFFMVQISTDMVFPGSEEDSGPYDESHKTGNDQNLAWYGASKAEGEAASLGEEGNAVVRIIYPARAHFPQKLDYARKILALHDEGKLYPMLINQQMNITYIDELAEALKVIASRRLSGIYHVASADLTTPYEFASYLIEKARGVKNVVQKNTFDEFIKGRDRRRYPQFGGLKVEKTQLTLGVQFSSWREIVDSLISSLQFE
ncbi:hypothetical protein A2803_02755 [Candidatus Woesebacteria bacterium RIFCSPHIGHO2_01_FULL_44_21]|uniref:dTDP-4-dehydrorhamnose reductase n=1 Tax=Candidatus Woesebacteria bacterium RIFCSPHIGHO2_01_FULL_44_21 TaxID=1802503 RepID=A0A1F7YZT1_9BACT|nr:MAG: hypothetical protein A2803_02755 [Candidatus Woesebacteria bacterium RIFCSPHIGHO2_01_FULL_44_21]OGM69807.1 MAG: hypothetical protein A2897_00490 [Candidatus Woesebacteria bacterium RIFCSPLOWO2_01_FULL_44_24b]